MILLKGLGKWCGNMILAELQTKWTENRRESEDIEYKIKRMERVLEDLKKEQCDNNSEFEKLYYHAVSNGFRLDPDNKKWRKCINITAIE